jgi:hypothetical protein
VIVLVILLIVTNLVTLGVLAWFALRPVEHRPPSRSVSAAIDAARGPELSSSATRRVITIEILNPIELAGTRGRIVGIAGSLAPGITRRVVYDQAIKLVRRHLAEHQVVADVRLHTVRPGPPPRSASASPEPALPAFDPATPVDLAMRDDEPDPA